MGLPTKTDIHEILSNLEEIDDDKPCEIILHQIKNLIHIGVLKPGDRLPAERALQEKFAVGRGQIRAALKKLEFYGILKTFPQSGTYVASLGVKSLKGLITNILNLSKEDFKDILETRKLLEVEATRLTARLATDDEIANLVNAQNEFRKEVAAGKSGLDEDIAIHLKIAEYCKNSVLRSLIALITPNILQFSKSLNTCANGRFKIALEEHELILKTIRKRDSQGAANTMRIHIDQTLDVCEQAYLKRLYE
jgi:GntR family transcriptional repressor for pyruvate dehydrogenase complex